MSAAEVPRLPDPDNHGSGGMPPEDLYRLAVEEYRWQAEFNWSRTRYFLVFSTGILAAGAALSVRGAHFAVPVFCLGILASVIAAWITRQQHDYYRAARKRMTAVEDQLDLQPPYVVDTTSTLGGRSRWLSVQQLVYLLLAAIALADVFGIALVLD